MSRTSRVSGVHFSQQRVAFLIALSLLLVLSLAPVLAVAMSLTSGSTGAHGLVQLLAQPRIWFAFGSTVALASAVTAVALLVGVPLGAVLAKTDLPGRGVALLVHSLPLFVPPFLVALGAFHLFGTRGIIGSPTSSAWLFSPLGLVAVLSLCFTPVVTWLTALGLRGVPAALEDAALVVTSPPKVLLRVLLPLSWPSIAFASLVVFALTLSDVGVAMFLRVRTYPAMVFSRLGGVRYAPGEAVALAVPLVLLALALLAVERRIIARRFMSSVSGAGRVGRVFSLKSARWPVTALVWATCLVSVLPVTALALSASRGGFSQVSAWLGNSVVNSLVSAALAATVLTVLGVVLGHRIARKLAGSAVSDAIAMLAFVTPSAVLGVGMIALWNHRVTAFIYTTMAVLVVGLSARYGVIALRTIAAVIRSTPPQLEDAAEASGASYSSRMARVVVPIHAAGILAAWLLTFVFCLRDLEGIVMFYPPGLETLPVRIFTLEANGSEPVVAALATTHVGITVAALTLFAFVGRRVLR